MKRRCVSAEGTDVSLLDRVKHLAAAGNDGVFIHDGGQILDADETAAALFGRALAEISRAPVADVIAAESQRVLTSLQCNSGAQPLTGLRKDGSRFEFQAMLRATLTFNGRRLHVLTLRATDHDSVTYLTDG